MTALEWPVVIVGGVLMVTVVVGIVVGVGQVVIESVSEGWQTDRLGLLKVAAVSALVIAVLVMEVIR